MNKLNKQYSANTTHKDTLPQHAAICRNLPEYAGIYRFKKAENIITKDRPKALYCRSI